MAGSKPQTQSTAPPEWVQGYQRDLLGQAWGATEPGAGMFNPETSSALSKQMKGGLGYLMDPNNLRADANPYFKGYTEAAIRPLSQQFAESVLPNIRSGAGETGNYGSSRQGIAEGLAAGRLAQTSGDVTSRMASEQYGQNLGGLIAGTQMSPAIAGAIQGLEMPEKYKILDWLRGFMPQGYGSTTQTSGASGSPLSGALGGGMLGNLLIPAAAGATPWGAVGGALLGGGLSL